MRNGGQQVVVIDCRCFLLKVVAGDGGQRCRGNRKWCLVMVMSDGWNLVNFLNGLQVIEIEN